MKRGPSPVIFGLVLLITSILLVGSMLLPRWQALKRQEKIEAITASARTLDGMTLQEAVEQVSSAALAIVHTGDTRSYLEPCGCYQGQAGGIARRAQAIKRLRATGVPLLVVDTGGILDGDTDLDRLRCEAYLHAMGQIGYDAVLLSASEFRFGLEFLNAIREQTHLPFLSSNLLKPTGEPFASPYRIQTVGSWNIALLGLSDAPDVPTGVQVQAPQAALKRWLPVVASNADAVILLSALPEAVNRRLALEFPLLSLIITFQREASNAPLARTKVPLDKSVHRTPSYPPRFGGSQREVGQTSRAETIPLAFSSRYGKTLGVAWWHTDTPVSEAPPMQGAIVLSDTIEEAPDIRARLNAFYRQVAADKTLWRPTKRLFASEPLEQDATNGYVGSEACQTCHTAEYDQWQTTRHARAFITLQKVQKSFYPDCVSCHSTGFGYPSGYLIGEPQRISLQGVGCETCHGPGKRHVSNPTRANTRRNVPTALCAQCHNETHHPGFMEVAAWLVPEVDHSQNRWTLRELLSKRVKGTTKPLVELFVMSFCPPGTEAEKRLIPILREFGDSIDFRLRFLASEEGDSFKSLHGQAEVEENIRQLVIEAYYPEALYDYLLCRANDLKRSWKPCAQSLGLDVGRIEAIAQRPEGRERLRQNIRRGNELGITGSPTLLVDGRRVPTRLFTQRIRTQCGP